MEVLQKENGWCFEGERGKQRLNGLPEFCLPELRAHILHLRVRKRVQAPYVRDDALGMLHQGADAGFHFFSDHLRAIFFSYMKDMIQKVDQREIGNILAVGVSVSFQPLDFIMSEGRLELFHQAALSRAGFSTDGENSAAALFKLFDRPYQVF